MDKDQVLICGAGPTGMVLALWLIKMGIRVRIIDKAAAAGTTSRALVMHARNLELYYLIGIDQEALADKTEFTSANLWTNKKRVATVRLSDTGSVISPYQFMLIYPQDAHEHMLERQLLKAGVQVERNTALIAFAQDNGLVKAQLRTANGAEESVEAKYLCGCDGAHSIVRKALRIEFPGGTYVHTFYVADLEATGVIVNGQMNGILDEADFLVVFPMKGQGAVRLVGTISVESAGKKELTWDDVSQGILARTPMVVKKLNWFSTYRVHHRVADHFRVGNVFLLGDAGHVHSPVGGQGMNTGIGDAINLAWKLAKVLKREAPENILETYEAERIGFARMLVATTDKAFAFADSRGFFAKQIRIHIAPHLVSFVSKFQVARRFLFKKLSQLKINYRESELSAGGAATLKGGDRLPFITFDEDGKNNYESLKKLSWTGHCYGRLSTDVKSILEKTDIGIHEFSWSKKLKGFGLKEDVLYIVRPDSYIGLITDQKDIPVLKAYLGKWIS